MYMYHRIPTPAPSFPNEYYIFVFKKIVVSDLSYQLCLEKDLSGRYFQNRQGIAIFG
jgi:hypothetical protein